MTLNFSEEMEEKTFFPEDKGFVRAEATEVEPGDTIIWKPDHMWRGDEIIEFDEDAYKVQSMIFGGDEIAVVLVFSEEPVVISDKKVWVKSIYKSHTMMYVPKNFVRAVEEAGGRKVTP